MTQYISFYSNLKNNADKNFPSLKDVTVSWDHLVSPHTLKLPRSIHEKVQRAVQALYSLSRRDSYQRLLNFSEIFPFAVRNDSVLMAYDFHTTASGEARLVEINTNASGFLISSLMNSTHSSVETAVSQWSKDLKQSFEAEGAKPGCRIAIVDDGVFEQKMYPEFLMYRDLFQSWGWKPEILEAALLQPKDFDFVYNRSTDFYLTETAHAALHEGWTTGKLIVSPQPREYFLLADKERLIDFTTPNWLESAGASADERESIKAVLIPTFDKKDFSGGAAELWSKRRNLFFKPKHAYGGKSVYRGESVSKKVFNRLMSEDILIQKFVPASPVTDLSPGDPLENWKFDVRFYVYRDRIQQVVARLYQGQVTNFASPFGGFTKIEFI